MLALPWRKHSHLTVGSRVVELVEGESCPGVDTTGSVLWDASQELLDHLMEEKEKQNCCTDLSCVLELGGGTGALAAALAIAGAQKVVCTDKASQLPLIARNALLNNVEDRVEARELHFGQEIPDDSKWTLIVACDVVYAPGLIQPLVKTLKSALPCHILICNKLRSESLINEFETAMGGKNSFFKVHVRGDYVIHEIKKNVT